MEYILIRPKNIINKEDMILLNQIDKIKEEIWNNYDEYLYECLYDCLYNKYNDIEIVAEEIYNEVFDLESIEDIFEFLDDNDIKYMIIEEYN